MKKCFIIIAVALFALQGLYAQSDDKPYLWNEFQRGEVIMKNGKPIKGYLNFHLIVRQFLYKQSPESEQAIIMNDPSQIGMVKCDGRNFIFDDKGAMREIVSSSPYLMIVYSAAYKSKGTEGAFGTTSRARPAQQFRKLDNDDRFYNLATDQIYEMEGVKRSYVLLRDGKEKMVNSIKQLVNAYPSERRNGLNAYIKEHNVSFEDTEQVLKLVRYAEAQNR